jgi:hypothetical protein
MHTPVLSDEPVSACALGRDCLCDDLSSRLASCTPPQTFGVFGDWGSGKTSFLRALQTRLEKNGAGNCSVIWFEAWRYQTEPAPIIALLHEIRQQLSWKTNFLARAKKAVGNATQVAIQGALLSLEDLTEKIGVNLSKAREGYEVWERQHNAKPLATQVIREQLEAALKTLLAAEKNARLVIFIDDLDRCHPASALRLLDGIKIYLNISKCVFVLGVNPREIQRGIEKEVPTADDDDHRTARAAEYLEKICGYAVRLPYLHPERQKNIVQKWLSDKQNGLHFPIVVAQKFAEIVGETGCLPPNPRKMKAWCNSLLQLVVRQYPIVSKTSAELKAENTPEADKKSAWDEVVGEGNFAALVACLYTFHPELHRRLNRNPMLIRRLEGWARFPTRTEAHSAITGRSPGEGTREVDLPLNDLSRLVPTYQKCVATWPDEDWDSHRCFFDPSLPAVFYCQRLLIEACANDGATAPLSKWLSL